MSEKRRDHRGRILHNGEIQLSDGRYRFKYVDEMGKERCVYSWRLDHNDATPKGKRRTLSLREMEKKIQADHFEQIATNGGNMTVLELVEKYTSTKTGVRPTTVRRTFLSEIIFFIYFEIEICAIEIGVRSIKMIELMNLMIVDFDNLFVLAANIFEAVVKLV
jgi:hypothetical protein